MKVVLLKDVAKMGRKFDIKTVSDGYAINYLIPNKFAEPATGSAVKRAEAERVKLVAGMKIQADLLAKNLSALESAEIELKGKASEKGHLFAGIHKEVLVAELRKQKSLDILPDFIKLEHPLKEVGKHKVPVLVNDKERYFTVSIVAE